MGKTKAELARWKTQVREGAAARKAANPSAEPSPSGSGEDGPPPKRTKLTSSTSSSRGKKHHQHQDDKLTKAFFPIGLPLEGEEDDEGERELDEAERYILSVREEEKKLPSFVTVYNPYVLPEQASSYIAKKQDKVYVAGPSAAQPSFAPAGPAPSPADLAANRIRPPHPMMPTRLWRQRFLANCIQLRANLKHPSTIPSPSNPGFSTSVNPPAHYVPVPGPGEREKWRQYIVGASRKKVKVDKKASVPVVETVSSLTAEIASGLGEASTSRASFSTPAVAGPASPRPAPSTSTTSAPNEADDEESTLNNLPLPPLATSSSSHTQPHPLALSDDDDEDADTYAFTDPTIQDGTNWYGADFDEDDDGGEEMFGAPGLLGGADEDEEEAQMNDTSDESSEEEEEWELEEVRDKHGEKEPSLTLLQTLPEASLLPLLTHLTHFLRPAPTLLSTHRSLSPSHPTPIPSAYPKLTPLYARWILSLLSLLPTYISPKGITQLRDLARLCMEVLESYAGGRRDGEGGGGEEERMHCWMIWGVVVEVWAQRDLVLDAEVVFGGF